MKRFRSSYLLIAAIAVLLVGFYSLDFSSNQASVFNLPDFTATTDIDPAEKQPVKTLKDFNDAIVNVADQAIPTVVTIRVTQTVEVRNPFSRFFGEPGSQERQRRGLGSGVIVSQDGYILTNNHVVEGADEIVVSMHNGVEHKGKVVGTDPRTDIAVVKIDTEDKLPVLKIGNSESTRIGEMVLAIGSPLGEDLAHSVSMGIISAKDRAIGILGENAGYENFLQTDAAINPGNSGGALINMDGELIGINSAIASRSGGNDGIGFAVPSNLAKSVMESLIENGRVVRGYLGIQRGGEVDGPMAKALGLKRSQGVIVGDVEEGGPADEGGLQEGDVILSLNGKAVENWMKFRTSIATSKPGDVITLGINRNGTEMDIEITLGELPEDLMATSQQPTSDRDMESRLGFGVRNLTPEIANQLELSPDQEGVVVSSISEGSNAYRQGLRRGAVITHVSKNEIENVSDFRAELEKVSESGDDVVLLRVIYQGITQYVAFEL